MFDATLKVTDRTGRWASSSVRILVGNQPPVVHLTTTPGPNDPFHFGDTVKVHVDVTDDEPVDCAKVLVHCILGHSRSPAVRYHRLRRFDRDATRAFARSRLRS